jgi:hypothetical protein
MEDARENHVSAAGADGSIMTISCNRAGSRVLLGRLSYRVAAVDLRPEVRYLNHANSRLFLTFDYGV